MVRWLLLLIPFVSASVFSQEPYYKRRVYNPRPGEVLIMEESGYRPPQAPAAVTPAPAPAEERVSVEPLERATTGLLIKDLVEKTTKLYNLEQKKISSIQIADDEYQTSMTADSFAKRGALNLGLDQDGMPGFRNALSWTLYDFHRSALRLQATWKTDRKKTNALMADFGDTNAAQVNAVFALNLWLSMIYGTYLKEGFDKDGRRVRLAAQVEVSQEQLTDINAVFERVALLRESITKIVADLNHLDTLSLDKEDTKITTRWPTPTEPMTWYPTPSNRLSPSFCLWSYQRKHAIRRNADQESPFDLLVPGVYVPFDYYEVVVDGQTVKRRTYAPQPVFHSNFQVLNYVEIPRDEAPHLVVLGEQPAVAVPAPATPVGPAAVSPPPVPNPPGIAPGAP
jgi:hypothetical protein